VNATAVNLAGLSGSSVVTFNVLSTHPSVTVTSPSSGAWLSSGTFYVNWTSSSPDLAYFLVYVNSTLEDNATSATTSYQVTGLSDGPYTANVTAVNLAGLSNSSVVSFGVDTTPPTVTITSPTSGATFTTSNVAVNWTGSDATSGISYYEVRNDSGSWINVGTNTSYTFSGLPDGNHTVDVRAFDYAGNNATASVNFTVSTVSPAQSQAALLALLSLAGTQGTSPMVYAAIIGVVGVVVVASGLFYYFRRMQA